MSYRYRSALDEDGVASARRRRRQCAVSRVCAPVRVRVRVCKRADADATWFCPDSSAGTASGTALRTAQRPSKANCPAHEPAKRAERSMVTRLHSTPEGARHARQAKATCLPCVGDIATRVARFGRSAAAGGWRRWCLEGLQRCIPSARERDAQQNKTPSSQATRGMRGRPGSGAATRCPQGAQTTSARRRWAVSKRIRGAGCRWGGHWQAGRVQGMWRACYLGHAQATPQCVLPTNTGRELVAGIWKGKDACQV
jgi:hypothetical protein